MSEDKNELGTITIAPRALATIASQAALSSYGVTGMASRNFVDGISHAIARDPRHGVEIHARGQTIDIDLHVIVEYGTRVSSVASSVGNTVRYQIERAIGMSVHAINVHVHDLRVSDVD
jgi:uncharacterized alkaline shock family protein YloU